MMLVEFLLLGLIGSNYRGYYSGKGKSGGGKFIGGDMGSKADADKYSELRDKAKSGDADAKKQMEQMRDEANKARVEGEKAKGSTLSSEKIHSVVRNEENRIQKEKVEHAVIVTPDGKVKTWTDNQPFSVSMPMSNVPSMHGAVFTHNHPGGKSFSDNDWGSAIQMNPRETRAIGDNGAEYSLKIRNWESRGGTTKPGSYDWGAYESRSRQAESMMRSHGRIQNKIMKDVKAKLDKAHQAGTLAQGTVAKLNQYGDHAINLKLAKTKLAKELGIEYSAKFNAQQQQEWAEVKGYFGL